MSLGRWKCVIEEPDDDGNTVWEYTRDNISRYVVRPPSVRGENTPPPAPYIPSKVSRG